MVVTVSHTAKELLVEVLSRRPVATPQPPSGRGAGLVGLAERVSLAGGELEHGVNADGDFVLRAQLPRTTTGSCAPDCS